MRLVIASSGENPLARPFRASETLNVKIFHKLILSALIPAVLILAVDYYATHIARQTFEQFIRNWSREHTENVISEIDRTVHARLSAWVTHGQGIVTQNLLKQSNAEFAQLADIQTHIDQQDALWRTTPKDQESELMRRLQANELAKDFNHRIQWMQRDMGYPVYSEVFITNRYGANAAQTNRTSDYRQDDETWWTNARDKGVDVGDVEFDDSAEVYSIAMSIRVDDPQGEFLGVMKVVYNIRDIVRIIQEAKDLNDGDQDQHMRLFTADRRLICSNIRDEEMLSSGESYFVDVVLNEHSRSANVMRTDINGEDLWLSSFAVSQGYAGYPGLGWIVQMEHNTEELFGPIETLEKSGLLIAVLATATALLIQSLVALSLSGRIKRLGVAAEKIGKGELGAVVTVNGRDEIGQLARRFNAMSVDLHNTYKEREKLQTQFTQSAREAGMAEIAQGVLHNVGNVLNSVNVSANLVAEKIHQDKNRRGELTKLVELMELHHTDLGRFVTQDERGRQIPQYLAALSKHMADEQQKVLSELGELTNQVEHIKQLVQMHQSFAMQSSVLENISPAPLMDQALKMAMGLAPTNPPTVVRQYDQTSVILTDPHKLAQVLVNLIKNAVESMYLSDHSESRLTLRIGATEQDAEAHVFFEVADTGGGFDVKTRKKLFSPRFTTKHNGHGYGLHSSANIARELRGNLTAHSTGVDQGAVFRLQIPVNLPESTPSHESRSAQI